MITFRHRTMLICAALLAAPAHAAGFSCGPAPITFLGIEGGTGYVLTSVGGSSGPTKICSVDTTIDSISPETCRSWLSSLMTLRSTGKKVVLYFNSETPSVGGVTNCAGLGGWAARIPYFLEFAE